MQHSQLLQGWQESQDRKIALRTPRTWLVSLGTFVISSLFIAAMLAVLYVVSPTLFASLFSTVFAGIVVIPLLFFLLSLFLLLFTNQAYTIKAYRKALRNHLGSSVNSYYSPEGSLAVQEYLAKIMSENGLRYEQKRHLLILGGPGSGKTANLKYAVYQAVDSDQQKINKLPVLIQMKYYNGFLRNLRVTSPVPSEAPTNTLLAYLLDSKHEEKSQAEKEPELIGLNHLHPYMSQLVAQGQIVF